MIYLSFIEFSSHGSEDGDDTEGHFIVACEAPSSKEVVESVLPAKLKTFEGIADTGDYTEFYFRGLVELGQPLAAPVVLGMTEGDIVGSDVANFSDLVFPADESHARGIRSVKISGEVPFLTIGEPPARIVDLAKRV